jgi:hypothetical protein
MSSETAQSAHAARRHILVSELRFVVPLWLVYATVVVVIAAIIVSFGLRPGSVWEKATAAPRWFALVWGIYQTAIFLPLFIAHGYARHEFARHFTRITPIYSAVLAALMTLGFGIEALAYRALGWPHALDETYLLFDAPIQFPLVFVHYALMFFAWIGVGALAGAAFYRWRQWALPVVPLVLAALLIIESVLGSGRALLRVLAATGIPAPGLARAGAELTLAIPVAITVYTLVVATALVAPWLLIRDLPMRSQRG